MIDEVPLQKAVLEYHEALQTIYNLLTNHLRNGGAASERPALWNQLDDIREAKYKAMIKLAGVEP